jgi:hypothetical protein
MKTEELAKKEKPEPNKGQKIAKLESGFSQIPKNTNKPIQVNKMQNI